jgi:transcriptional regulator with XRE-family HTH domain
MSALSVSAPNVRFQSGPYLHRLLVGVNGEMNPDEVYPTFVAGVAARARERRLELGLETDDVARRVTAAGHKLKGSSVENWERGDLPLKHVGRLAEALEMPWQQLLGLAPAPVRVDPLEQLAAVVGALVEAMETGTAQVFDRLEAIERRLPASAGRRRPKGGDTPAAGGGV